MPRTVEVHPLDDLLDGRWTCRKFLPDKEVPFEIIESLLRAAQRTPSWSNTQPWGMWVTNAAATSRLRAELAAHLADGGDVEPDIEFPVGYPGLYGERRRECGHALYASLGVDRNDHGGRAQQFLRNFSFFDAPHVAVMTSPVELGTYGVLDCGLYLSTFLLAAQARGVAAAPQAAPAAYSPFLHRHFGIDRTRRVIATIGFGYPDLSDPVNHFRTSRAAVTENVVFVSESPQRAAADGGLLDGDRLREVAGPVDVEAQAQGRVVG
ncbi:nitroreductase family protein, partial [Tsukamurella paurometabola]